MQKEIVKIYDKKEKRKKMIMKHARRSAFVYKNKTYMHRHKMYFV